MGTIEVFAVLTGNHLQPFDQPEFPAAHETRPICSAPSCLAAPASELSGDQQNYLSAQAIALLGSQGQPGPCGASSDPGVRPGRHHRPRQRPIRRVPGGRANTSMTTCICAIAKIWGSEGGQNVGPGISIQAAIGPWRVRSATPATLAWIFSTAWSGENNGPPVVGGPWFSRRRLGQKLHQGRRNLDDRVDFAHVINIRDNLQGPDLVILVGHVAGPPGPCPRCIPPPRAWISTSATMARRTLAGHDHVSQQPLAVRRQLELGMRRKIQAPWWRACSRVRPPHVEHQVVIQGRRPVRAEDVGHIGPGAAGRPPWPAAARGPAPGCRCGPGGWRGSPGAPPCAAGVRPGTMRNNRLAPRPTSTTWPFWAYCRTTASKKALNTRRLRVPMSNRAGPCSARSWCSSLVMSTKPSTASHQGQPCPTHSIPLRVQISMGQFIAQTIPFHRIL